MKGNEETVLGKGKTKMEKQQKRLERQLRWIKEGMKNFRLSLSLRVSLNYLRFFLINGVLFFGIMGLLYLWEEMKPSKEIVEQLNEEINPKNSEVQMLKDLDTVDLNIGQILFDNLPAEDESEGFHQ